MEPTCAPKVSSMQNLTTQMQILKKMDTIATGDNEHMFMMHENNMDETKTFIVNIFLKTQSILHIYIYLKFLNILFECRH